MTDGEVVRRVVAGDTAAYGILARRWFYRILAYCQSRLATRDLHAAEDLAQEVLIRGFSDLGSITNPDQFGPWLRGIAKHVCSDWERRRVRGREVNEPDSWQPQSSSTAIPLDVVEANDEKVLVLQEISTIPEELREVILLHYYEDLTYDEMARWLGVARATVNERLAKARSMLRVRLAMLRSDV